MTTKGRTMTAIWVTWTLLISSYAVFRAFEDPSAITAQTVAALTAVIGMPPLFVGLYKWIRPRVEK